MFKEIFYANCIGCGFRSENGMPICIECIESLEKHPHECESCGYPVSIPSKICGNCKGALYRDRVKITYKYQGALRQLIKQIKFGYRITGIGIIKNLLDIDDLDNYDIVTDVPSHYTRKLRRLKHPAKDLARHIALSKDTIYTNLLIRIKKTEYQYKLKKHMRARNVKNAFQCIKDVKGKRILLVDDIITTGSTAEECSKVLKHAGASVVDIFALTGGRS